MFDQPPRHDPEALMALTGSGLHPRLRRLLAEPRPPSPQPPAEPPRPELRRAPLRLVVTPDRTT